MHSLSLTRAHLCPWQANHRMLPPDSCFKKYWNRLIVVLVMYNTLFIVLVVCYNRFDPSTGLYWYEPATDSTNVAPMVIDYLVDVIFLIDIGLTFRTTFFDQENEVRAAPWPCHRSHAHTTSLASPPPQQPLGSRASPPPSPFPPSQLVLDKKVIARAYLKFWFPIDLIATLPLELLGYCFPPHILRPEIKVRAQESRRSSRTQPPRKRAAAAAHNSHARAAAAAAHNSRHTDVYLLSASLTSPTLSSLPPPLHKKGRAAPPLDEGAQTDQRPQ